MMILRLCTLSEPKVRQPWQNPYSQSSIMILSLGPFSGAVSAQGPFPPFKATASSLTAMQQPLTRTSLHASISIASVLGAPTGSWGESILQPMYFTRLHL